MAAGAFMAAERDGPQNGGLETDAEERPWGKRRALEGGSMLWSKQMADRTIGGGRT